MNSSSTYHSLLKLLRNSILILSLLATTNAWSGGLFLSEHATHDSVGSAGVSGITNMTTAEAGITNPAGLVGLEANQLQVGAEIIDFRFEYETTSPSTGKASGSSTSLVPAAFYAYPLNDNIVLGTSLHGSAGLGFDLSSDWAGKYFINDADISFLNLTGSIGYKVNEKLSLGGSLVVQQFQLEINTTVAPVLPIGPDRSVHTEGDDVNLGYTLGLMYQFTDATRVGFHFNSKIEHDLDMSLNIPADIPIIGPVSTNYVLETAQPSTFSLGVSHQLDQEWRLMGMLAYERWSEFGEMVVKPAGGGSIDANMNLEDLFGIGIAAEHTAPGRTTYFGATYFESAVSDENRIMAMPLDEGLKLGIGAEWALGGDRFYGLAYELILLGDAPVTQTNGTGTLKGEAGDNYIQVLSASYRY
jgi:long-chain fatty acid transport protein